MLLPPACLLCRRMTFDASNLCPDCWQGLEFISAPYCAISGTPFAYDIGSDAVSAAMIAQPPDYQMARAPLIYNDIARRLITGLKFSDRLYHAALLGRLMGAAGHAVLKDADMLVPIPLHRWRFWRRRFNQSALLALEIQRSSGVPVAVDVLHRHRATAPQRGLGRNGRRRNVAGAFSVPAGAAHKLAAATVVLVDDVLTTGATTNAAARVLRRAGAAQVRVLAAAMVTEPMETPL